MIRGPKKGWLSEGCHRVKRLHAHALTMAFMKGWRHQECNAKSNHDASGKQACTCFMFIKFAKVTMILARGSVTTGPLLAYSRLPRRRLMSMGTGSLGRRAISLSDLVGPILIGLVGYQSYLVHLVWVHRRGGQSGRGSRSEMVTMITIYSLPKYVPRYQFWWSSQSCHVKAHIQGIYHHIITPNLNITPN